MQPASNPIVSIIRKINADSIPKARKVLERQILEKQIKDLLLLQVEVELESFYKKLNKQHRKLLTEINKLIKSDDQTFQSLFNTLRNDPKRYSQFSNRPDLVLLLNAIIHHIDLKCVALEEQFNHDIEKIGSIFAQKGDI